MGLQDGTNSQSRIHQLGRACKTVQIAIKAALSFTLNKFGQYNDALPLDAAFDLTWIVLYQ
jgi:hypothetical protein